MRRLAILLSLLVSTPALAFDQVTAILAAQAGRSPGGATISPEELFLLKLNTVFADADDALAGIAAAAAARANGAFVKDEDYGTLQLAQRARVVGLAPASLQAPGLDFHRGLGDDLLAFFDAQGVDYTRVDLVFTTDEWQTTRAVSFDCGAAILTDIPASGTLIYALHVFGADGRDFWLANGRESGVYGGTRALDFRYPLAAAPAWPVAPSAPAFARLIEESAAWYSPDGAEITMGDFSMLVEQLTWEGGPGTDQPAAIDPALVALDDAVAAGVVFAGGIEDGIRGFLVQMRFATARLDSASFSRGANGSLLVHVDGARRVDYSTDGWQIAHSVTCTDVCDLGAIAPGTYLSYAVQTTGGWLRSPTLGNFFHDVP
jgi:hypothetical protein